MSVTPASSSAGILRGAALRWSLVISASLAVGVLTRIGERTLPASVQTAANSTAPWVLATFLLVFAVALRPRASMLLGAASFVAMDLGFYVAFGLSGGYYPHRYLVFWVVAGLVAGPLVGLMATWVRGAGWRRVLADASVPSIFIGEGIFILVRLPLVGHVYPTMLIGGGVLIVAAIALMRGGSPRTWMPTVAATAAGSAVFALAYNLVPLVIGKVVP